eukprot:gene17647-19402_t
MITVFQRKSRIVIAIFIGIFICIFYQILLAWRDEDNLLDFTNGRALDMQVAQDCSREFLYKERPRDCGKGRPLVLALISSLPNRLSHRSMLRKLLAPEVTSHEYFEGSLWKVVFVVARTNNLHLELKVKREINIYRDVVWSRFREDRSTQLYKTLVAFSWAYCHCKPKYIVKTNEDSFLNVKILVNWLLINHTGDVRSTRFYVTGFQSREYHIPGKDEFEQPHRFYNGDLAHEEREQLQVAINPGYLISFDVLLDIIHLMPKYRAFALSTDAYVDFVIKKTGIHKVNNEGFLAQTQTNLLRICDYRRIFVSFNVLGEDLPKMFEESSRSEFECSPKITLFRKRNESKTDD